jgi:hypothetical protein
MEVHGGGRRQALQIDAGQLRKCIRLDCARIFAKEISSRVGYLATGRVEENE